MLLYFDLAALAALTALTALTALAVRPALPALAVLAALPAPAELRILAEIYYDFFKGRLTPAPPPKRKRH